MVTRLFPSLLYAALLIFYLALLAWCVPIRAHAAVSEDAPAPCAFVANPGIEQRLTLDVRLARALAAMITDEVPAATAWALQLNWPGDMGATLVIADDHGCALAVGPVSIADVDKAVEMAWPTPEPVLIFPWDVFGPPTITPIED